MTALFAKFDASLAHFQTLSDEASAYLEKHPYSTTMEFDAGEKRFSIIGHVSTQPSLRFGTRVGDVIHNLSSALDLAMYELAALRAGREVDMTSFPLYGSVWDFRKFRRRNDCWMRVLTPSDRTLIERFQPYRGGNFAFNHPLAQLYRLRNQDEHRTLHVTLVMISEFGFTITPVQDVAEVTEVQVRVGSVVDGAEILRAYVVPNGPDPQVNLEGELAMDIGVEDQISIRSVLAAAGDWVQHILGRISKAFPESPTWDEWKAAHADDP